MPSQFPWQLVLTSAAVAAIVSALATLIGQAIDRRSRKRELLLSKAIDLAQRRTDHIIKVTEGTGRRVRLQDDIVSAETYFRWLEHLFEHGRLPDDPQISRIEPDRE